MSLNDTKKVPGNLGLPLIGNTLPFLKDGFSFIQEGIKKYGPVFRTRFLGEDLIFIAGPEASEIFINEEFVIRAEATPNNICELFGFEVLPQIDGKIHKTRKRLLLKAFTMEALASYIPALQKTIESYMNRWTEESLTEGVEECKKLAIEGICVNTMGLKTGPEMDMLLEEYKKVGKALTALPIPLPGTTYKKGVASRIKIVEFFETLINERKANLGEDGLSRILQAELEDGSKMSVEEIKKEMHHVVIGGFIIWAQFIMIMKQLDELKEVKKKLIEEIKEYSSNGAINPGQLRNMTYLNQFVKEVKRISPSLPGIFGRANKTFEFNGFTVEKGKKIMWSVCSNNLYEEIFKNPNQFDPERFSEQRAENKKHPHAFVPQGAGPDDGHKCPGTDYTTLFMQLFTILLLRNYQWEIPNQNLSFDFSEIPPTPKDGFKINFNKI